MKDSQGTAALAFTSATALTVDFFSCSFFMTAVAAGLIADEAGRPWGFCNVITSSLQEDLVQNSEERHVH